MREYLQVSFYTFTGIRKIIDLGNFIYGEWIIYENIIPKYHISAFDKNSNSNVIINSLIESKKETIESIISKINVQQDIKLSFGGSRPFIELIKKKELINLELAPLPEKWVENITT